MPKPEYSSRDKSMRKKPQEAVAVIFRLGFPRSSDSKLIFLFFFRLAKSISTDAGATSAFTDSFEVRLLV
jgi:hypothetical protein